jgi:hypothetical protein
MYPNAYLIYCYSLLAVCALTGCLLVKKSWTPWYKLLVILTWITVVVEAAQLLFQIYKPGQPPVFVIYNVWMFVEPFTMIYILYCATAHPVVRRLEKVLLLLLPIGLVICYIHSPRFTDRMNEYVNLMCLFAALIASCSALIDILLDMSDRSLFAQPVLWLAAGILCFCSTFILIHAYGAFYPYQIRKYYVYFSLAGNTFQYGGFIACFLALRKKNKKAMMTTPSSGSLQDSPPPPLSPGS